MTVSTLFYLILHFLAGALVMGVCLRVTDSSFWGMASMGVSVVVVEALISRLNGKRPFFAWARPFLSRSSTKGAQRD